MPSRQYITESDLAVFLGESVPTGEAEEAIKQATALVEAITDRVWEADDTAVERRFSGNDRENLLIDECIEITEVKLALDHYGDTYEVLSPEVVNGYYPMPRDYAEQGEPIYKLHLRGRVWLPGSANHIITARWGYSETPPDDIKLATTILSAGVYKYNRGGGMGNIKSERIGNYSVAYDNDSDWDAYDNSMKTLQTRRRIRLI